jgi:hypothetical protein
MSQYSQHSFNTSKNLQCSLRVWQMHWNLLYILLKHIYTHKAIHTYSLCQIDCSCTSTFLLVFQKINILTHYAFSKELLKHHTSSIRANKILSFLHPIVFFFLLLKLKRKALTLLMINSFIFYWFRELVYMLFYTRSSSRTEVPAQIILTTTIDTIQTQHLPSS